MQPVTGQSKNSILRPARLVDFVVLLPQVAVQSIFLRLKRLPMPKRLPLVCEHLENISRDALEKYQDVIRSYVRHRQGVYALYRRSKLYYVGLAKDLRWRLKAHLKDRHGLSWDRFSVYLTIGDKHLRELEALVLRIAKPKGNEVKGKFAKSQDLRRKLARDLRLIQRQELDLLLGRVRHIREEEPNKNGVHGAVMAAFLTVPTRLRGTHKGKILRAHVRRDGRIRFSGKVYDSPSAAGAAAVGRRTCNGWSFWKFERAPGDWVKLRELRR